MHNYIEGGLHWTLDLKIIDFLLFHTKEAYDTMEAFCFNPLTIQVGRLSKLTLAMQETAGVP